MNAVCYKCGAEKHGPLDACDTCGVDPRTDKEITLSFCVCNNYVEQETLAELGPYIKEHGRPPILPDFIMEDLQDEALVFHGMQNELKDARKVDKAVELYNAGDFVEARAILLDVVLRIPIPYQSMIEGDLHTFIKFWDDESFLHYMRWHTILESLPAKPVIRLPNTYPRAYYWLALLDMENNDYQLAANHLLRGRELDPTSFCLNYLLGLAYQEQGELEKALEAVSRIDLSEQVSERECGEALIMKARILADLKRYEEAMGSYRMSALYGASIQETRMFPAYLALKICEKTR